MTDQGGTEKRRRGRPSADAAASPAEGSRVEAVERALTILDAFDEGGPRMTLAELAKRTGLYPSTILRLAGSLARFGYLHRDTAGLFRLGPTPLRLGQVYRQSFDLTDYVRPALARLCESTGETVAFYVRDGDMRICLYRHNAPRTIRHHLEEGAQLPLDRGAAGRVLLAFTGGTDAVSEATRTRGFYVSYGERDREAAAVAMPIHGLNGSFVGALNISGLRDRFTEDYVEGLRAKLATEAGHLTRRLGGR